MRANYLVECEDLHALIERDEVVVIDTRPEAAYARTHLPGAVNIHDIFTYLVTRENGGLEAMAGHFKTKLEASGIRRSDRVVIYEDAMDNGYGQSCRGRFLLHYLGHEDVRVLHGGYRAWRSAGLPLTDAIPQVVPSTYDVQITPDEMLTAEDILAALDDPAVLLLDCRDHAEWVGATSSPYGVDFNPRKGRIPGAVWIEWYRMMYRQDGIPWIKDDDHVLKVCEEAGITADSCVYIYCFKGARASNMLMALKMAGIPNVRNYLGSWNEWSRDFSLPIDEDYPA